MEFSGQYLTYEKYQSLGGTLSQVPFNLLEFKSRKQIDKLTLGRLIDLAGQKIEVKLCINELIAKNQEYTKSIVSSESTDGYSINYNNKLTDEQIKEVNNIIKSYLSNCYLEDDYNTPYLYIGTC